ncbi:ABC transporter permease [Millisia brevis]|uniref:ABC transporter permease n=1 Tax=Millisia brevis TaxID=264148 RepID=UPI00082A72B8|nr:ABC transporter permease [Millisia brevis]
MIRYVAYRLAWAVAVIWAAFTVAFGVLYVLPSDPVSIAAGAAGSGTPVDAAAIAEMQQRYGLDKSVGEQYVVGLGNAVTGDFGRSIGTGQPVTEAIAAALPSTIQLALAALVLAVVFGGGLAILATYLRTSWLRTALLALPPLGVAVPTFWSGLILLDLFSFRLPIFPAFGDTGFTSLVLPAIALAIPTGAMIAQVLATSLIGTARQPFVDTARAKGASDLRVHVHHLLRLSSIPALTIAGVLVGDILAGAVVVETVFARNGLGRLTQTAVLNQDIPVVLAVVLFSALVFVLVNLVVDLIYPLIDPRVVVRAAPTNPVSTADRESSDV